VKVGADAPSSFLLLLSLEKYFLTAE